MRSAWTRRAPRATNISPTADFPDAMPPVRPTFSMKVPPRLKNQLQPQNTETQRNPQESFSLCLCVSVVNAFHLRDSSGMRLPRRIFAAFTVLYISIAMVSGRLRRGLG